MCIRLACGCLLKAQTMMRRLWLLGLVVIFLAILPGSSGRLHKGSTMCEKYDHTQCIEGTGPCETTVEECANLTTANNEPLDEPHNHMLCFTSWITINNSQNHIVKKGCWMNDNKCFGQSECVEDRYSAPVFFCCCDGDYCNKKYVHRPSGTSPRIVISEEPGNVPAKEDVVRRDQQLIKTLLYSIVPILGLGIIVVTLFFMWRRHQHHLGHTQLPTVDPSLAPTPSQSSLNLQLLELRARGRYGSLWKARLPDQEGYKDGIPSNGMIIPSTLKHVAVKIFPLHDKLSWIAEVDIYNLPRMKHENILLFIASERKEDSHITEFWLITEFHENGSLCDFLKGNTITWAQLCNIGESMTCGLAYLHDEIPANNGSVAKLAIAHRDLKSKNVLLKSDLTACIADFGLALKFEPGKVFNETHPQRAVAPVSYKLLTNYLLQAAISAPFGLLGQVGTRRYMAPEVLEGAICFSLDSFLRIDMYACGLVIWEMMTRCTSVEGPVDSYRLPFEAEVGLQPTLEEMQTLVVTQKMRPAFNVTWHKHQGLSSLISTVEECWDQDAEARLSAGCVKERIMQLSRTVNSGSWGPPGEKTLPTSPLLSQHSPQIITTSSLVPSPGSHMGSTRDSFITLSNDPVSC